MAFYYVKVGGTATGDGGRTTTARTGAWNATASEYYHSLTTALAAATPPTDGDWLVWSDASNETIPGDTTVVLPNGVNIVTVDDNNQDTYSTAISPQIDNADRDDYVLQYGMDSPDSQIIAGANIVTGDPSSCGRGGNTALLHEFTYRFPLGSNGKFWAMSGQDADNILAFKQNFGALGLGDYYVQVGRGGSYTFLGGMHSGSNARGFYTTVGGADIKCYGRDFSGCGDGLLVGDLDTGSNRAASFYLYRCLLPANWIVQGARESAVNFAIIESCDSEYQYEVFQRAGEVEFINHATDFVHSDDEFLSDGATRGSYKFETDVNFCGVRQPLFTGHIRLPRWLTAENTESATKTKVRIKFASAAADPLDDSDVIVYVLYPNATNTYALDAECHFPEPLKAGGALPTESGKWSGVGTENQYTLDVQMNNPGDGLVLVWVGFTVPGKTIYLSAQIDFVA